MKIETHLKIIKGEFVFVPLINVVFLLLIFFILSSAFVQVSTISLKLPTAEGQLTNAEKLVVTIDNKNRFYFNDQVMDLETLKEQLARMAARYQIKSIIIMADKETPHGVVTNVLALANSLNLNVYFAVAAVPKSQPTAFETD